MGRLPLYTYEDIFFVVGNIWGATACVLLVRAWIAVGQNNKKNEELHRRLMIVMTVGGWAFVLLYLFGYYMRTDPMNIPRNLVPWIAVHGTVSLVSLSGATVLAWARITRSGDDDPLRFRATLNRRHTLYGKVIASLWLISHAGGVANLYIVG